MICKLALEDGAVFTGEHVGATGTSTGEVVFNTAMTGYQEVFTDPSYCGQIVTMTFPLQGNYGVNEEDFESVRTHLSGVVLRELPRRPSNYRSTASLAAFLEKHGVIGVVGVDTRAVTRRIRETGALRGVLSNEITDDLELVRMAKESPSMEGANLVTKVAPTEVRSWAGDGSAKIAPGSLAGTHVVAIDCGIKHGILRCLTDAGCRVTVVPAAADVKTIESLSPDGLLAGNGPGDPAAVAGTADTLKAFIGKMPIFGICLGHQLLSLALGAKTYKLAFGHHGANVPVIDRRTDRVAITSQNHGFAVDAQSLTDIGAEITHVNLNDGSVEGFAKPDQQVWAVQFHPEASPGPHDAAGLFAEFAASLGAKSETNA